jgi:hypothetical protein
MQLPILSRTVKGLLFSASAIPEASVPRELWAALLKKKPSLLIKKQKKKSHAHLTSRWSKTKKLPAGYYFLLCGSLLAVCAKDWLSGTVL